MSAIGIRAHDLGTLPADALAFAAASFGFDAVQLALNKAIANLSLQPGDLTPQLADSIAAPFAKHNVRIAVLGCYINLSQPDPHLRNNALLYFKDHLRHARHFNCPFVATETGSLNANWSPHPNNHSDDAYAALLPILADLLETAEDAGTSIAIEPVAHHVLHSPQRTRQLLDDLRSPALRIILDPVNLLSPANYTDQERIIRDAFDLFGDHISILHAKDFTLHDNHFRTLPAGRGLLHYDLVLDLHHAHCPDAPILLEETEPHDAAATANFLRSHAPSAPRSALAAAGPL